MILITIDEFNYNYNDFKWFLGVMIKAITQWLSV